MLVQGPKHPQCHLWPAANKVLIVLTGEPTSFIDAYSLIKVAFIDYKMDNFGVIINMAASNLQAKLNFEKFQSITQKFLDVKLKFLGHVPSSLKIKNSICGAYFR